MEISFFSRLKLSDWYDPTSLNLTGKTHSQNDTLCRLFIPNL